jgi:ribosomal protein L37AE/L43A
MKKCKPFCDLTKAVKTGEATWICATCKADVSMLYLWWAMAAYGDDDAN